MQENTWRNWEKAGGPAVLLAVGTICGALLAAVAYFSFADKIRPALVDSLAGGALALLGSAAGVLAARWFDYRDRFGAIGMLRENASPTIIVLASYIQHITELLVPVPETPADLFLGDERAIRRATNFRPHIEHALKELEGFLQPNIPPEVRRDCLFVVSASRALVADMESLAGKIEVTYKMAKNHDVTVEHLAHLKWGDRHTFMEYRNLLVDEIIKRSKAVQNTAEKFART